MEWWMIPLGITVVVVYFWLFGMPIVDRARRPKKGFLITMAQLWSDASYSVDVLDCSRSSFLHSEEYHLSFKTPPSEATIKAEIEKRRAKDMTEDEKRDAFKSEFEGRVFE